MRRRYLCGALVGVLATVGALTGASAARSADSPATHSKMSVMRPLGFEPVQRASAKPTRSNNLAYQGGIGGIGVETAPTMYLVLWGSQWTNNNTPGEEQQLANFISNVRTTS